MRSGWTTLRDSVLSSLTLAPSLLEWPCQEQCGSGLTTSALVLDVSAPYTNEAWPLLQLVNVAQKNKPSTMLSSCVQSIDLSMDCMTWQFLMMRHLIGHSTPAPRYSEAKQWIAQTSSNNEGQIANCLLGHCKCCCFFLLNPVMFASQKCYTTVWLFSSLLTICTPDLSFACFSFRPQS